MTFEILGDDIYFGPYRLGSFPPTMPTTQRDLAEDLLGVHVTKRTTTVKQYKRQLKEEKRK